MSTQPPFLITGGTRGIGLACAQRLADRYTLFLGGRSEASVEQARQHVPGACGFVADLADDDQTRAACERLLHECGGSLAGVVHSAALLGTGALADLDRETWRTTFDVNVFAVAEITRMLTPALARGRGTVVMINSGSGLRAHGPGGVYSASKHALGAFTDAYRAEVAGTGIRVSSIHPGRVATDMQRDLRAFEGGEYVASDYLSAESVAAAVDTALHAADDASIHRVVLNPPS